MPEAMPDHTTVPLVSVIMPVYNGARFLREAIDSIRKQTLHDFEFIIIDDGSTDATPAILAGYAAHDARIRIESLPENQGIVAALNYGCALARGRYLARMDADDISLPDRLRIQADYLDHHPEIGAVGTSVQHIDVHGTPGVIVHPPLSPGLIRWRAFFASPMAHSSVMLRRALFEQVGGYDAGLAQDYNLWLRMGAITDLANLPEVLLYYRLWEGTITSQHAARTNDIATELAQRSMAALLGEAVSRETAAAMRAIMVLDKATWPDDPDAIMATARWLVRVCAVYAKSKRLCRGEFATSPSGEGLQTLPYTEMRKIKGEVAFRLVLLARRVFPSAPHEGLHLMLRALRLHPLVMGHIVVKIGARVFRLN